MQTTEYARDDEGYLINPLDWNENLADKLAKEENLQINEQYQTILMFMRHYWEENQVAPDVRHVISHLVKESGLNKKQAKQHLFKLFPYGYVKQACKIAGMQRPRAWSTG